jgi:hypothetical protein
MSYVIQALHPTGENFHYQRTLMTLHTIRENPRNPWLKNLCSLPATADYRLMGIAVFLMISAASVFSVPL